MLPSTSPSSDPQPPPGSRPASAPNARAPSLRDCVVVLAAIAVIGGLKLAGPAVVPVLFALFVALLLSPLVEMFVRRGLARVFAALLVMLAVVALVAACLTTTWRPARDWLETAPATMRTLEAKIRPVTRFIAKVQSVSTQAEQITEPSAKPTDQPTPVSLESKGFVESTQEWIITIVSMLFLTLFLLAADLASLGRDATPGSRWGRTGQVFERVRGELARYFAAVTFSNLLLGIATAGTMAWLDMPNPLLWGVMAFAFNFVPYAGSATTLVLLTIVALVSFDGLGKAFVVAGTYLVLTTLEGQVLQPVLVGRRLDISPPLVLLGLWFGGWMWGVAGVAIATPLLVTVKVAAEELSRADQDVEAERRIETVRTRASQWLARNSRRYRRTRNPAGLTRSRGDAPEPGPRRPGSGDA
jgi:predicted PurR-regulated permease PerM